MRAYGTQGNGPQLRLVHICVTRKLPPPSWPIVSETTAMRFRIVLYTRYFRHQDTVSDTLHAPTRSDTPLHASSFLPIKVNSHTPRARVRLEPFAGFSLHRGSFFTKPALLPLRAGQSQSQATSVLRSSSHLDPMDPGAGKCREGSQSCFSRHVQWRRRLFLEPFCSCLIQLPRLAPRPAGATWAPFPPGHPECWNIRGSKRRAATSPPPCSHRSTRGSQRTT